MDTLYGLADKGFNALRDATVNLPLLGGSASLLLGHFELDPVEACRSLSSAFDVQAFNTTILDSTYFDTASEVKALGVCQSTTNIGAGTCRVQLVVNTSAVSAITAEAWLPANWSGRFLAIGNGGLDGCEYFMYFSRSVHRYFRQALITTTSVMVLRLDSRLLRRTMGTTAIQANTSQIQKY